MHSANDLENMAYTYYHMRYCFKALSAPTFSYEPLVTVSPENFVGCYKGGESHETSDDAITLVEGLTKSSLACIHACQSKRKAYRYAAVQYGTSLCSCGYTLVKYGQATSFTECVNGMPERNIIHKICKYHNMIRVIRYMYSKNQQFKISKSRTK